MEINYKLSGLPHKMSIAHPVVGAVKTGSPSGLKHSASPRFTPAGRAERMHSWNLRMQRLFAGQHY